MQARPDSCSAYVRLGMQRYDVALAFQSATIANNTSVLGHPTVDIVLPMAKFGRCNVQLKQTQKSALVGIDIKPKPKFYRCTVQLQILLYEYLLLFNVYIVSTCKSY